MKFEDYGIEINTNKVSGEVTMLCPKCSHERTGTNKRAKVLSVNLDKNTWFCHHCGWKGYVKPDKNVVYKIPEWKNKTELSDVTVRYFETRKISQPTLKRAKVTEGMEWMPKAQKEILTIQFNYFRDGQLVNIKYRGKDKDFKMFKEAELIFYNLDGIRDSEDVIIVEGEMDALTLMELGITNVISVPNGATLTNNNLSYVDNCMEQLFYKKRFILCLDNDQAGRKLRADLVDRLGIERCVYVEFPGAKDANEYLCKEDLNKLKAVILEPKEFPLEGSFTVTDIQDEIYDLYHTGLDMGQSTGIPGFNLRFVKGYITTVTGIPGHGKSDFVDYLALSLHRHGQWRGAFYSPENKPTELHFSKMARKILGKGWYGDDKMTWEEVSHVADYLDKEMWFIKPETDYSLESILRSVKQLKNRFGLDFFVIDAWNKLAHKRDGKSETDYTGECLDMLDVFCTRERLHLFLIAHPVKMQLIKDSVKYQPPTLYSISGSAHFYNKSDNGITVYRDFETEKTTVLVTKVKFSHWGETGQCEFYYDKISGRYYTNDYNRNELWIK